MLYRIDTDTKETLVEIMQKLNTTQSEFMLYWYCFDYYEKGKREATMDSSGWFVDLDEHQHDLNTMADVLSDYVIIVDNGWKRMHEKYSAPSTEDEQYFNANLLYIRPREIETDENDVERMYKKRRKKWK